MEARIDLLEGSYCIRYEDVVWPSSQPQKLLSCTLPTSKPRSSQCVRLSAVPTCIHFNHKAASTNQSCSALVLYLVLARTIIDPPGHMLALF